MLGSNDSSNEKSHMKEQPPGSAEVVGADAVHTKEINGKLQRLSIPRLQALDGSRFVGAMLIVAYHFYGEHLGGIAHGGSCWVSYFFLLSGFVLAYREMTLPSEVPRKSTLRYVKHRLTTIYPIYIFSLLTVIFEATRVDHSKFEWNCLPLHFMLAQAWLPICSKFQPWVHDYQCCSTSWNSIAWYVSTLVPFWLIVRPLSLLFRKASVVTCLISMALLWTWTIVPTIILHFNVHNFPGVVTWDWVMTGPFGYWHIFSCGIPAARLFIKLCMCDKETGGDVTAGTVKFSIKERNAVPLPFRWGAVTGYSIALLFLGLCPIDFKKHGTFFHSGGLLPLMLLIIAGLGSGHDPLAHVLSVHPFILLGSIAYAMYLLQFRIFRLLVFVNGEEPPLLLFPLVLILCAYVFYIFIEVPYTQWQQWRAVKGKVGIDDKVIDFIDGKLAIATSAAKGYMGGTTCANYLLIPFMIELQDLQEVLDEDEPSETGGRNWLLNSMSVCHPDSANVNKVAYTQPAEVAS